MMRFLFLNYTIEIFTFLHIQSKIIYIIIYLNYYNNIDLKLDRLRSIISNILKVYVFIFSIVHCAATCAI